MRFAFTSSEILIVLLVVVPLWWIAAGARRQRGMMFPTVGVVDRVRVARLRTLAVANLPRILRGIALAALMLALAGPVLILRGQRVERDEVAIVLAVDLSSSMLAEDMEEDKTRMAVARETAIRFVMGRPADRIGLVAFAGEALTRMPPSNDTGLIVSGLEAIDVGLLRDGTDISGAIVAATNRLAAEPHASRIMILLTDGAHNAQGISPYEAARAASANGIQIYAISILGSTGEPGGDPAEEIARAQSRDLAQEIETVLTQVARVSGGRYFHASDEAALDAVYTEIDRLATTSVALLEQTETVAIGHWFLIGALLFVCAEAKVRGSSIGLLP